MRENEREDFALIRALIPFRGEISAPSYYVAVISSDGSGQKTYFPEAGGHQWPSFCKNPFASPPPPRLSFSFSHELFLHANRRARNFCPLHIVWRCVETAISSSCVCTVSIQSLFFLSLLSFSLPPPSLRGHLSCLQHDRRTT